MTNDRSSNCKENPDVQIPKSTLKPRRSEFFTEWCTPLDENPVGEVLGSDLKKISLHLSFTESQDAPYGSTTSQYADKYIMMITLQKIPQTDGPTPANKTQLSEWP
jgi:hypothetical protein